MREFNLNVTEQELQVISAGLVELPYKVSSQLIAKLQVQINEQIKPKDSTEE